MLIYKAQVTKTQNIQLKHRDVTLKILTIKINFNTPVFVWVHWKQDFSYTDGNLDTVCLWFLLLHVPARKNGLLCIRCSYLYFIFVLLYFLFVWMRMNLCAPAALRLFKSVTFTVTEVRQLTVLHRSDCRNDCVHSGITGLTSQRGKAGGLVVFAKHRIHS